MYSHKTNQLDHTGLPSPPPHWTNQTFLSYLDKPPPFKSTTYTALKPLLRFNKSSYFCKWQDNSTSLWKSFPDFPCFILYHFDCFKYGNKLTVYANGNFLKQEGTKKVVFLYHAEVVKSFQQFAVTVLQTMSLVNNHTSPRHCTQLHVVSLWKDWNRIQHCYH